MVGASSDLQYFTKIIYKQTNTSADITVNDKKLAEVTSLKYLGKTLSKNCHGDRSDCQTEHVVDKQFHQLPHKVKVI
ncbi:hypothetical protein DPMN_127546 [Dreissena polymorpha]|uniref:Uncharacterized protein n=1 Tax=Dreissena polymorpha TaxID=45954 RepID=A0A9D4JUY0_DREPO|nr:hypothetical protein DPMN_127546 [Dreissena polymorpha]